MKLICTLILSLLFSAPLSFGQKTEIVFGGSAQNDIYHVLVSSGFKVSRFDDPEKAIEYAKKGTAVLIMADQYPSAYTTVTSTLFEKAKKKKLKLYIEYPSALPGFTIPEKPLNTSLERGVVTSSVFMPELKPMDILGINDCHIIPLETTDPLLVLARVAGFNKAEYGIDDVEKHPILFEKDQVLIAATKLSNFATGRYGPNDAWQRVWTYIIKWATDQQAVTFKEWPAYVTPAYGRDEKLPADAIANSIEKGVKWFENGRFYIHPDWEEKWKGYQGDGTEPFGPSLSQDLPNGDGTMGLLEGHASNIYHDGSQQYRYWVRADVQGEGAYALAAASDFLKNKEFGDRAEKLIDYIFYNSNLRSGPRNNPESPSYGLIGWSVTHPHVYYGDDNARVILGILGASAFLNNSKWDKFMTEAIMANFRTTGALGFRGERQEDKQLQEKGWEHFNTRELHNPAPHFESWMWACYLWLYEKTGYQPLLDKTKTGIRNMMKAYPDQWKWTNGIQQERARMILPLAWLVRIEDTAEHRQWLDLIVQEVLKNQVESGAIREELGGAGQGRYGRTKSNKEYGLHEAPLIFTNGDPIADMLYTSNFAFFSLNEAAHATGNPQYRKSVEKLADFLIRIQVKSDRHNDLDGAWFRAFEYDKWEYWASNADAGWGAWGTLTGWTQSWIVAGQVLNAQKQNFWDLTKHSGIKKELPAVLKTMKMN